MVMAVPVRHGREHERLPQLSRERRRERLGGDRVGAVREVRPVVLGRPKRQDGFVVPAVVDGGAGETVEPDVVHAASITPVAAPPARPRCDGSACETPRLA